MLPRPFVDAFVGELSHFARIRVPDGRDWQIRLERGQNSFRFHTGFRGFMKHYSLGFGSFLLFKYEGESVFDVHIYDCTTTEISYPANPEGGLHLHCSFPLGEVHEQEAAPHIDAVGLSQVRQTAAEVREVAPHSDVAGLSRARKSTTETREAALNAATSFHPSHPWFILVLKDHHVICNCSMAMLQRFPQENLCINAVTFVKLQGYNDAEWPICCIKDGGKVRFLSKGWSKFVKDNNLAVVDV